MTLLPCYFERGSSARTAPELTQRLSELGLYKNARLLSGDRIIKRSLRSMPNSLNSMLTTGSDLTVQAGKARPELSPKMRARVMCSRCLARRIEKLMLKLFAVLKSWKLRKEDENAS